MVPARFLHATPPEAAKPFRGHQDRGLTMTAVLNLVGK